MVGSSPTMTEEESAFQNFMPGLSDPGIAIFRSIFLRYKSHSIVTSC
jgi:hypothetical protein